MTATMPSVRTIDNPIIGDRATFHKTYKETRGKETLIEVELSPKGGNGHHYHIGFSETFTVLEGQLTLEVNRHIIRLQPGETATARPMDIHRFFNETDHTIRFMVSLTPGHEGFEKVLQIAYGLARDGHTRPDGTPKNMYHLALLVTAGGTNLPGLARWFEAAARLAGPSSRAVGHPARLGSPLLPVLEPIRKPRLSQKKMNFKVLTKCFFDGIAALRLQKNTKPGS